MTVSAELLDAPSVDLALAAPVEQILARCDEIHDEDKKAERRKKIVMFGGIALLVPLVIILTLLFDNPFVMFVALILGFGGGALVYSKVGAADVEDRKLEVVQSLLTQLGPELRRNRPVKVDVDFSAYTHSGGSHQWLKLEMALMDGTGVRVQGVTSYKRKTRAKRKYTKIKDKVRDRLIVTLAPPKGHVFNTTAKLATGAQIGGMQVRRWNLKPKAARVEFETGVMMRIRGRQGWTGVGLERSLDGRMVLAGIMASYRMVAASNRG